MKKMLVLIGLLFASCNIPQIEDAKCTASRETVRSFFSQHLSEENATGFTFESMAKKAKFLTPELNSLLQKQTEPGKMFTEALPTGFKVGECKISGENSVVHTVRLFAMANNKAVESEMKVDVEKRGNDWLIDDLTDDKNKSLTSILKQ